LNSLDEIEAGGARDMAEFLEELRVQSQSVKVRLTEVAKRHVRAEGKWWRENRDEKALFDEELSSARLRLMEPPKLEVCEETRGRLIRRMYLTKTQNTV